MDFAEYNDHNDDEGYGDEEEGDQDHSDDDEEDDGGGGGGGDDDENDLDDEDELDADRPRAAGCDPDVVDALVAERTGCMDRDDAAVLIRRERRISTWLECQIREKQMRLRRRQRQQNQQPKGGDDLDVGEEEDEDDDDDDEICEEDDEDKKYTSAPFDSDRNRSRRRNNRKTVIHQSKDERPNDTARRSIAQMQSSLPSSSNEEDTDDDRNVDDDRTNTSVDGDDDGGGGGGDDLVNLELEHRFLERVLRSKQVYDAVFKRQGTTTRHSEFRNQEEEQNQTSYPDNDRHGLLTDSIRARDELVQEHLVLHAERDGVRRRICAALKECHDVQRNNRRKWEQVREREATAVRSNNRMRRRRQQRKPPNQNATMEPTTAMDNDRDHEVEIRTKDASKRLVLDLIGASGIDWYRDETLRDIMMRYTE